MIGCEMLLHDMAQWYAARLYNFLNHLYLRSKLTTALKHMCFWIKFFQKTYILMKTYRGKGEILKGSPLLSNTTSLVAHRRDNHSFPSTLMYRLFSPHSLLNQNPNLIYIVHSPGYPMVSFRITDTSRP